jgi:uncharacterized protein
MSDAKPPPEPSIDEILATIRRIISDDEQSGVSAGEPTPRPVEIKPAEMKPADDDVLELTEALNEDGTTRRLAPIGGGSSPRPTAAADGAPAALRVEPQLRLRPSSPPGPEPQRRDAPGLRLSPAPALPPAEPREPLLSADTPLGSGPRSLEDIVRDTLQPLLQAWLDEHLPPIVERYVQEEITRTAREAAGRG